MLWLNLYELNFLLVFVHNWLYKCTFVSYLMKSLQCFHYWNKKSVQIEKKGLLVYVREWLTFLSTLIYLVKRNTSDYSPLPHSPHCYCYLLSALGLHCTNQQDTQSFTVLSAWGSFTTKIDPNTLSEHRGTPL
jgi:hypothetical protein